MPGAPPPSGSHASLWAFISHDGAGLTQVLPRDSMGFLTKADADRRLGMSDCLLFFSLEPFFSPLLYLSMR
jgi:hypothetical protein